jgi:hypothetical protein
MNRHAMSAPPGKAYEAVGMHRALDSATGLPRRSTSAPWMLMFVMPADVSSSLMMPLPHHVIASSAATGRDPDRA